MEIFPAADATPWDLIKTVIADSDYYVLIVGGRYGSTGPEGISYTEMEYDFAHELGKPIIGFVHGEPDLIPAGKSEMEPEARRRLDDFRNKIAKKHFKTWITKDQLKSTLITSLVYTIRTNPQQGWVRNQGLDNQELLTRLAQLQAKFDLLSAEAEELKKIACLNSENKKYADGQDQFDLYFGWKDYKKSKAYRKTLSWDNIFYMLGETMLVPAKELQIKNMLVTMIYASLHEYPTIYEESILLKNSYEVQSKIHVDYLCLRAVIHQFLALRLIEAFPVPYQQESHGNFGASGTEIDRFWALTEKGRVRFLDRYAVLAEPVSSR